MAVNIQVVAETPGRGRTDEQWVEVSDGETTLRALIRAYVYQAVTEANAKRAMAIEKARESYANARNQPPGAIAPHAVEQWLNGDAAGRHHGELTGKVLERRLNVGPERDFSAEFVKAIEAFEQQRMLVLVGETQVTELDAPLAALPTEPVTFLQMVPLVGG